MIGHNIIGFDLPVLGKLLGFEWWGKVEDTLVMSRLDNPSREGGHSLASWGTRMNFPKGEYDDWSMYTESGKAIKQNYSDQEWSQKRFTDLLSERKEKLNVIENKEVK